MSGAPVRFQARKTIEQVEEGNDLAPKFDDLRFIELVDDAGHWVQMEQPAATNALILRFLESLDRRR